MQNQILKFKQLVIQNFSRPDFVYGEWIVPYHLEIVERLALELCELYPEANRDVVETLVWFHDFGKPIDEKNEKEVTLREGVLALVDCGFPQDFIDTVVMHWKLMEQKNEIDLHEAPIETQIISSADGASHFVGLFYPTYFGDGHSIAVTQEKLKKKIGVDWNRKITLPEVKKAFEARYKIMKELYGEFPDTFI